MIRFVVEGGGLPLHALRRPARAAANVSRIARRVAAFRTNPR
jgi:hypothetical protein